MTYLKITPSNRLSNDRYYIVTVGNFQFYLFICLCLPSFRTLFAFKNNLNQSQQLFGLSSLHATYVWSSCQHSPTTLHQDFYIAFLFAIALVKPNEIAANQICAKKLVSSKKQRTLLVQVSLPKSRAFVYLASMLLSPCG